MKTKLHIAGQWQASRVTTAGGLSVLLLLACLPTAVVAEDPLPADLAALAALIDEAWEFEIRENPIWATRTGDNRYNDLLPSVSVADEERQLAVRRDFLARLEAIDRASLDREQQINRDILARLLADWIAEAEFESYLVPLSNRDGFHVQFAGLPQQIPLANAQDYENYIARLRAFGHYTDQTIELMRVGMAQGQVPPDVTLVGWQRTVAAHIVDDPKQSVFHGPFTKFPRGVPLLRRPQLVRAGRRAISESIVPAYQRLQEFMEDEYVPAARGSIGASALPRGREFYRYRVRHFTTLDITPDEIHQLGLAEVERIAAEMDEVRTSAGFEGSHEEFLELLRSDSRFHAESPEDLMQRTALVLKEIDGRLPQLFGRLPRTPYGIREVPDYEAPTTTTAYYRRPTGDGSTAGVYFVNTYDLPSRPLYEMTALSLHEAVPGHHLQLALQQELEELPSFRRHAGFTVFVEGWALYAESLGTEMGMYEDPYDDFGRLSYEMWRACRLVVDTGIHYQGWTRQQAIEYLAQHTALSAHNIRAEVDRYIGWPGQAVAYKVGELKIRRLRTEAEEQLGDDFDVRDFHDVVLGSGALPLDVLEENVQLWIDAGGPSSRQSPNTEPTLTP